MALGYFSRNGGFLPMANVGAVVSLPTQEEKAIVPTPPPQVSQIQPKTLNIPLNTILWLGVLILLALIYWKMNSKKDSSEKLNGMHIGQVYGLAGNLDSQGQHSSAELLREAARQCELAGIC